jgi:hypothetical protein
MALSTLPILAAAETTTAKFEPLFGNQWLALLAILAGIAVFMLAVAAVGRWLAATHPDEPLPPAPIVEPAPSAEIFAAIAAAVAVTCGGKARIATVQPIAIDPGQLQWSAEGRRQIYSSHKVR